MAIVEHVIRMRCAVCKMALEFLQTMKLPELPCQLTGVTLGFVAPPGWTVDRQGLMRCPQHEESLVVTPIAEIPGNLKRGRLN